MCFEFCRVGCASPKLASSAGRTSAGGGPGRSRFDRRWSELESTAVDKATRTMSMLKGRYLAVCDRLIRETGTENVGHRIPKAATLKQCVMLREICTSFTTGSIFATFAIYRWWTIISERISAGLAAGADR